MDIRLRYPKKYLSAHDLQGGDVTLTIRRITSESLKIVGGVEKPCVILYFEEALKRAEEKKQEEKRLVLNVTNRDQIASVFGTYEEEDWAGKKITLYPTTTKLKGKTVDCIRVRDTAPAEKE